MYAAAIAFGAVALAILPVKSGDLASKVTVTVEVDSSPTPAKTRVCLSLPAGRRFAGSDTHTGSDTDKRCESVEAPEPKAN
ncbi:hypothetical protein [Frankia sp. Cj3]|uniref:hypothetical protein n=1 Tax=Frankia sp. Cj3 TaxID=2880976 RepID=UPI001EF6D581|nr:hypothetical protein [Frankia sp. Cj3]